MKKVKAFGAHFFIQDKHSLQVNVHIVIIIIITI